MPSNLIQYKVFLAWTSNLQKEKEKFEDVLNSFSREREEEYCQSFRAVHSSQISSSFGRPQAVINEKIKSCDYAVFVLYDNLGSDAGGEGKKTGIEEEWDFVKQLQQNRKIRDVALFFKKLETDKEKDPGDNLKKLLSFKDRIRKEVFFNEYSTLEDFENKLRKRLIEWASSLVQNNKDENSFQLLEFSTSSKECETDTGKEPPSFHYWMWEVNQLLECEIKTQNGLFSPFPEEYTNALFCAKKALEAAKSKGEKLQAWNSVGQTKFYLRDYQGTIECCEKIISQFGEENALPLKQQVAKALFNKGVALGQLGQWEESVKSYDDVIRRFGGETDLLLKEPVARSLTNKGVILGQLGQWEESVKSYDDVIRRFGGEMVLSLKEQVAKALYNKGVALGQLAQWEESVKSCDDVIRRFGGEMVLSLKEQVAMALYNKGVALCQLKHEVEAIGVYDEVNRKFGDETALSLKEQVAMALYNKGITLCQLGYWKESSGVFEEVIRRFESVASSNIQEIVINARKQPKFTSDW